MTALVAVGLLGLTLSACGGGGGSKTTQARPHDPPTLTAAKMAQWDALANDGNALPGRTSRNVLPDQSCLALTASQLTTVYNQISPPGGSFGSGSYACNPGLDTSLTFGQGDDQAHLKVDTQPGAGAMPLQSSGWYLHYTPPSADDPNAIPPQRLLSMVLANLAGNPVPTTEAQLVNNYSSSNS